MPKSKGYFGFLSGNSLKLLACVFMFFDHFGMIFFPSVSLFRGIGRLAFPIFAFMIAEGAKYTRSKLRYFLNVGVLALGMEGVYYLCFGQPVLSIFVSFSFSLIMIFSLDLFKGCLFSGSRISIKILSAFPFIAAVLFTLISDRLLTAQFGRPFDYGFIGACLPLLASFFRMPEKAPSRLKMLDNHFIHLLLFALGLAFYSFRTFRLQLLSLLALPILTLYSGKRGRLRIKYFFYIFYPLHLCILQIIYWIINA